MKLGPRSLFGSRRSRFFQEPKSRGGKTVSYKRKQRVRFRSRYAGNVARRWTKTIFNTTVIAATLGAAAWGAFTFSHFWKTSDTLRVKEVVFSGDIPERLRSSFPIKTNDSFILLKAFQMERETLSKYPELISLSIRRRMDRTLRVSGKFRTPVARTRGQGDEKKIDASGVLFTLPGDAPVDAALPWVETASVDNRLALLALLASWKKELPDFYSLVKKIETDRMRELYVELSDGVLVQFGPLEEIDAQDRAKKILKLRAVFHPAKTPATLSFVTSDRIVMDKNWQKGGAHVETGNSSGN